MYAVITTGSKQYKVKKGDILDVEKLEGKEGSELTFDNVLFVGDSKPVKIGRPYIEGASVGVEIEKQFRAKKVIVYKKKRRRGYEVHRGHRQYLTKVRITSVKV